MSSKSRSGSDKGERIGGNGENEVVERGEMDLLFDGGLCSLLAGFHLVTSTFTIVIPSSPTALRILTTSGDDLQDSHCLGTKLGSLRMADMVLINLSLSL